VDRFIFRKVCSFMEQERDLFQSRSLEWVSVNVSPQFFLQTDATQWVIQELATRELHPSQCRIEVTEKTAIDKAKMIEDNLQVLQESGIQLAVDDFGTGYSSLTNLKRLPVDILKIDRALLIEPPYSDDEQEILRTAIRLAEVMNLTCITEGIETAEQLQVVKQLGSPYAQGFLFDKPLPPEAIRERIE